MAHQNSVNVYSWSALHQGRQKRSMTQILPALHQGRQQRSMTHEMGEYGTTHEMGEYGMMHEMGELNMKV